MFYATGRRIESTGERIRRRNMEVHRRSIRLMKANVDNELAPKYLHWLERKKKESKNNRYPHERYRRIERENRCLLENMAQIMSRPSSFKNTVKKDTSSPIKCLHQDARRRFQEKIMYENEKILKRIQGALPNYDHREWEKHWQLQKLHLRTMCQFPCVLFDKQTKPKRRSRKLQPLNRSQSISESKRKSVKTMKKSVSLPCVKSKSIDHNEILYNRQKPRGGGARTFLIRKEQTINDVSVIVTVTSLKPTSIQQHIQWEYKIFEPHLHDEVKLIVALSEISLRVKSQGRSDLLDIESVIEMAEFSLQFLCIDTSSGSLHVTFQACADDAIEEATEKNNDDDDDGEDKDLKQEKETSELSYSVSQTSSVLPDKNSSPRTDTMSDAYTKVNVSDTKQQQETYMKLSTPQNIATPNVVEQLHEE